MTLRLERSERERDAHDDRRSKTHADEPVRDSLRARIHDGGRPGETQEKKQLNLSHRAPLSTGRPLAIACRLRRIEEMGGGAERYRPSTVPIWGICSVSRAT
jgi:hypothetical protein